MVKRSIVYTVSIPLFFVVVLSAIYMESPLAKVKTVEVSGNANISAAAILRDANIRAGENLFQIPIARATQRLLADFPLLKSVAIARDFFSQSVAIDVKERALAGILEAGGTLYQVLADGVVLDRDPAGVGANQPIVSTSAPLAVSLGQKLTNPNLLAVCRQLPQLPQSDLQRLSQLDIQPYHGHMSILAFTRDGFEIRMPVAHLATSMRLYDAIHSRLMSLGVAPGLVDLVTSKTGIYRPYKRG